MAMAHGGAAFGVMALVASTALLVWICGKEVCGCQKFAKFLAWVAVAASILILIGQAVMCYQCNVGGKCARMPAGIGKWHGYHGTMPPPLPPAESDEEKAE